MATKSSTKDKSTLKGTNAADMLTVKHDIVTVIAIIMIMFLKENTVGMMIRDTDTLTGFGVTVTASGM